MTARPIHSRRPALICARTVVTKPRGARPYAAAWASARRRQSPLLREPPASGLAPRPDVTADLADPVGRRPGRRWPRQISSAFLILFSIMIVVPRVSRPTYSRHRHATKKLRNLVARPTHASHVPARLAGWRVAESRATIEAPAFSLQRKELKK